MSGEVWGQVYDRLAELVREHRTTLVFVNTRRQAERVARYLSERVGEEHVAAHHGSLARDRRLDAEQRLKRGELKALVATASLELGIDIGDVDLVCQIGSHAVRSTPSCSAWDAPVTRWAESPRAGCSRSSRDELVECAALLDAVRRGELDRLEVPTGPLDVLTQQIAAEVSSQEWHEDALYALVRRRVLLPRPRGARSSTSASRCSPKASSHAAGGTARSFTATPSTRCCARGAAGASRPSPPAGRFRTMPTTASSSSPKRSWSAR